MYKWLGLGFFVSTLMLSGCAAEDPAVGSSVSGAGAGSIAGGSTAGGSTAGGAVAGGAVAGGAGGTLAGGNPGGVTVTPDDKCGSIEQEAKVARAPVDIVLALDTSGSMTTQICNVSKNLAAFADAVGKDTRVVAAYQIGVDLFFQFVVLCQKDDPLAGTTLAADTSRYQRVDTRVDSTNALQVLLDRYDTYKAFLRPGSPTHFVVVSDDESNLPGATFKTQMEAKLGHPFYLHAIVAMGNGCNGANIGTQYMQLADQTGGKKLSICAQDWSALFKELEAAVVASAPLACEFAIPQQPAGMMLDASKVSVIYTPPGGSKSAFPKAPNAAACAGKIGWHYDNEAAPTQVQFCPAACTQVRTGGKLGIAFGCAPPPLL
jgi:hypothetical protein